MSTQGCCRHASPPIANRTGGGSGSSARREGYSSSLLAMSRAPTAAARSSASAARRSADLVMPSHACSGEPNVAIRSLKRTAPTPGRSDSASAACRERSLGENGVGRLYLCRLAELQQLAPEGAEQLIESEAACRADRVHAECVRRVDGRRLELAQQIHLGEDHAVRCVGEMRGV